MAEKRRGLIRISDRWSIERDAYCWMLRETVEVESRREPGTMVMRENVTYWPSLVMAAAKIIEWDNTEVEDAQSLLDGWAETRERVIETLSGLDSLLRDMMREKRR